MLKKLGSRIENLNIANRGVKKDQVYRVAVGTLRKLFTIEQSDVPT